MLQNFQIETNKRKGKKYLFIVIFLDCSWNTNENFGQIK